MPATPHTKKIQPSTQKKQKQTQNKTTTQKHAQWAEEDKPLQDTSLCNIHCFKILPLQATTTCKANQGAVRGAAGLSS